MARSQLQANISSMVYDTRTWLNRTGDDNVQHVGSTYHEYISGITNLIVKATSSVCSITVAQTILGLSFEDLEYNSNRYLTSTDSGSLRDAIISIVNNDPLVNSYADVSVHSWRMDDQKSEGYTTHGTTLDGLEIFIHGISYHDMTYLEPSGANNVDTFLAEVNDALDTIPGLEFAGVNAVSSVNRNPGFVFVGLNDATYNGNKYLSSTAASTLKGLVETALDSINQLIYDNVQIIYSRNDGQCSDNYHDYD